MGAPREDQDGPTSDTRGQAVGCNMVTQRQSKMLKMTPRWHRVSLKENWGVPEKTKMVQQKTQEDLELAARWLFKDKSEIPKMTRRWHRVKALGTLREGRDGPTEESRPLGVGTKMATHRQSKSANMSPRLHRGGTLGPPREHKDGPTEDTRGLSDGTQMAKQRQSNMVKMSPRWHRVRTLGAPREDQDGTTQEARGLGVGSKMATERHTKMAKMRPRWQRLKTLGKPSDLQSHYKHLNFASWFYAFSSYWFLFAENNGLKYIEKQWFPNEKRFLDIF